MRIRRIAFFVFPGLTLLDLVGGYDAFRRVATLGIDRGLTHRIVGTESEVADESGLVVRSESVYEDLDGYDLLYVSGGPGTRSLMRDDHCLDYLRSWGTERPLASVCTGALLLGAAGLLQGKRATTHRSAFDLLQPLCGTLVTDERVVPDGGVVTAGGVSASLDLGLYLVERFWGRDARERISAQMEYEPRDVMHQSR
jgi:transcriptional regulator GlxA family with amidase domain